MIADLHVHTQFSGDSDTPVRAQIDRAIALGMSEICITDHHDYDAPPGDCDFTLDIDAYLPYIKQVQTEYQGRIRVSIGIELGLQCHLREYLNKYAASHSFDFIIGSSHFIDGMDPYHPVCFADKTEREVYERFFEITLKRVQEIECYDSLGHLDYVVRYGPNHNHQYSYAAYQDYLDPILKTLISNGKGLECNTGGYKYGLGHPNPNEEILTRYRELGGEILTVGSDSHVPEYTGYEFARVRDVLEKCGFRYYTVFHNRKPEFLSIK